MMATFPHPGGMPGHTGMPPGAQQMASGHPGAQGMPGGQPGMMGQQMHGMGGPQMSQGGPMMNISQITPGMAGPSPHAMSHLTPGNAMHFQHQQHQQQMAHQLSQQNPQLLQVQQQQRMRVAQAQQQQQAAQQAQQVQAMMIQARGQGQGNMSMGGQPYLLNQQQGLAMPPHMTGIQQQVGHQGFMVGPQGQSAHLQMLAMQQAHQQAQVHQAQQAQQQQAQQAAAVQQAHQQAQAQAQAAQAAQQAQQAATQATSTPNQPAAQPMRPTSTIPVGPDGQNSAGVSAIATQQQVHQQAQTAQAQAAQQSTQQQENPQTSQAPSNQQPQAGPQAASQPHNVGTPQPQPTPQQTPVQPPQSQAHTPQQPGNAQLQSDRQVTGGAKNAQIPGRQMQGPPANNNQLALQQQRIQQAHLQQQQQQQQQQAAQQQTQSLQQSQQSQQSQTKQYALKLLQFSEGLSAASPDPLGRNLAGSLEFWKTFVKKFFSDTAVLRQELCRADGERKQFDIPASVIARFYWTQFKSRVRKIQMAVEQLGEREAVNGHLIECKATFFYWYGNEQHVVMHGALKAIFNRDNKFDLLEFSCHEWNEHVQLKSIPQSPEQKTSPTLNKKKGQPLQQKSRIFSRPRPSVGDWGVVEQLISFFELTETFSHMGSLFEFSQNNSSLTPKEALGQLVQSYSSTVNVGQFNPALQSGAATPNSGFVGPPNTGIIGPHPQQFNSPAGAAHLGLPNAAAANMSMSPAMHPHGLHQGVGGSGVPSANTSPNAGKRRRHSQVKMEDEGASSDINGANKVKQSPRVPKRIKPGS